MSIWRPHTTGILIGGVILIVIASTVAFMVSQFEPKTEVRMGSGVFSAKLADTEMAREKGLSGVTSLSPNDALLMVFDSDDTWGIWMKDMKVPIDIVWLDEDKKVVYIVSNVSPELSIDKTFKPKTPARYVVEVAAGQAAKNNVKVGSTVVFLLEGEK